MNLTLDIIKMEFKTCVVHRDCTVDKLDRELEQMLEGTTPQYSPDLF
jgi:hypothetical protein